MQGCSRFNPASFRTTCIARAAALLPLIACLGAHAAPPLPSGGKFVAGSGSIGGGGQSLTIDQTSTRGVIDWNSFSIGGGRKVTFNNGSGATLNRVTGGDPSVILGQLSATGSVYLINPQGVIVGPGGVVTTGGRFLASALDVSNSAFMAGGPLTLSGGGNGMVVNLGKIGSTGGDVVLVSRSEVVNNGQISAPNGTAELATGAKVLLQDSSGSQQVFVQTGSGGEVMNTGAIRAAQVSLQAADGNVYALAGNSAAIRATGTATRDGHVWLVADSGAVHAHGAIAAVNADGSGGIAETRAKQLDVSGATVQAGTWKLGAPTFTLNGANASTVARNLSNGTSVDVEATGANGNVTVGSSVRWTGDASLTLGAGHNVGIAAGTTVANSGAGNLIVRADSNGVDNGGSVKNRGTIDWSKSTGIVSLLYDMNGSYAPGTLLSNNAWTAAPYSGQVTQITAYKLVNSFDDLMKVSQNLAGNYALGKDIDASASKVLDPSTGEGPYSPIGLDKTAPFTGQFDGFGHTIDSLNVDDGTSGVGVGLFGVIGTGGAVRNITMTNGGASGFFGSNAYGILAGWNYGTIANAKTSGFADNEGFGNQGIGGLVGVNNGLIERSSSDASVGISGPAGGLVGVNNGTITQSFASGDVSAGNHGTTGGLVAVNNGTITESYATNSPGGVQGTGSLVNVNGPKGVIKESFATGGVGGGGPSGDPYGGIASVNQGTIDDTVYWDKDTTTQTKAAGQNTGKMPGASNGLTTAQMGMQNSFTGWTFGSNGVWAMPAGATHPVLEWQQAQH